MALVNANGVNVQGGTIEMPLEGVWVADLVLDNPQGTGFDAGTRVTLAASDGVELTGTVAPARSGSFLDSTHVRLLGGAAGMARAATPRGFVQPGAFVRDVLRALAANAGESLSSSIPSSFFDKNLTAWAIHSGMVSSALRVLLDIAGPTLRWRILPDGTLWMGEETWPDSASEFFILEQEAASATSLLRAQSPAIAPGQNVPGIGRASRVQHDIFPNEVRTRVWTSVPEDERGVQHAVAVISEITSAKFDYYATYRYRVMKQSSDLTTVDVSPIAPNDQRLPGLDRVPVREGSAVKVQFTQGGEVLLGWDGGDPERPYVCSGLSSDSVQRIQLAGNVDAARKGDSVDIGLWSVVITSGSVSAIKVTPPGGGLPVTIPTDPATAALSAEISGGSDKIGLG